MISPHGIMEELNAIQNAKLNGDDPQAMEQSLKDKLRLNPSGESNAD